MQAPIGRVCSSIPPNLRFGGTFAQTYNLLRESQWWSEEQIRDYQIGEMSRLLAHCKANVPYYAEVLKNVGEITSLSDIEQIPFLTRDAVRENLDRMRARNLPERDFIHATTGGSSGQPLAFYLHRGYSSPRECAFFTIMWGRVGYRFGRDERLVLRGAVPRGRHGVEHRPISNEVVCSTYHLDEDHMDRYFEVMRSRGIRFLHGHVSSLVIFAQYMLEKGRSHPLQAVFGGSEKVFPFQREIIEKAFDCRLFSWYGQSEQVALAGACEHADEYHVFPEYGILELIDENGGVIHEPGVPGEIVATGFNSFAMPLIRYRTGDIASYADGPCPHCGRRYPRLQTIEGRSYDYVITASGVRVSLTGLMFGQHFSAFGCVLKMQLMQDRPGRVEIRIVPGRGFDREKHEREIRDGIAKAVGNGLEATFAYPEDIPATQGGKHKFLIQLIETADRGVAV